MRSKASKDRVTYLPSKRLNGEEQKNDVGMMEANEGEKRKNLGRGQFKAVPVQNQQINPSGQK